MSEVSGGEKKARGFTLDLLLSIVLPVAAIGVVYLAPFARDRAKMPYGFDTIGYIWRINVVHDFGVNALSRAFLGHHLKPLGERPADLVVVSILRSLSGRDSLTMAWLMPAVFASSIGLAAGSLATDGLHEARRWSFVTAIGVGASAYVAWTAVGYATNLALDVAVMAAAVICLRTAFRNGSLASRSLAGGVLLLAGGALLHWVFALLFFGVLVAFALALALGRSLARRARHSDLYPPRGAATRVGIMVAMASVLAVGYFALAPNIPVRVPKVQPGSVQGVTFAAARLPSMALWITLPLAVIGAALVALIRRENQRIWGALLLLGWASLAAVGLFAWYVLRLPFPPYRWGGFALGIPALITLGALAARSWLGTRFHGLGTALGWLLICASLVGLVAVGASVWTRQIPRLSGSDVATYKTISNYLNDVPLGTPIVFGISGPAPGPKARVAAGMPVDRLPDISVIGAVTKPDGSVVWKMPPPPGAVEVFLSSIYTSPAPAGDVLGLGMVVINGPKINGSLAEVQAPTSPAPPVMAGLLVLFLLALGAAGSGWASALTDVAPAGVVALSPAFGLVILGPAGMVASRLGVPLHGPGAISLLIFAAGTGWILYMVSKLWRRRHQPGEGSKATPPSAA